MGKELNGKNGTKKFYKVFFFKEEKLSHAQENIDSKCL